MLLGPEQIPTLREIREGGHYCVDKTGQAIDLIDSGKAFFLSRPRRFGLRSFYSVLKSADADLKFVFLMGSRSSARSASSPA